MEPVQKQIRKTLTAHTKELNTLAARIHANPEIGLEEKKACAWHTQLLRKWGFAVQTPFAGLPTAYKAVAGSGKPAFCFMAEYDALPDIGHACGHNLISGAAVGAGLALAEVLRAGKKRGTVVVMGTPAEEGQGGKVMMIEKGALRGIDAVMLAHPRWRTEPDLGCSAITRFNVKFTGRAAHAAEAPEQGRNALDAVMLLFHGVNAWRQQLPESCRIHGIVSDGGALPNIIPEHAACIFYLRAMEDSTLEYMARRFSAMAKGAALMTETKATIEPWEEAYKSRLPNKALNEAYMEAAEQAGLHPVVPNRATRASSDFGDVSQERPAAHVHFGISHGVLPAHSVAFREAAASPYGMAQMIRVAEAMAVVGHRYFTDPSFQRQVQEEFKIARRTKGQAS